MNVPAYLVPHPTPSTERYPFSCKETSPLHKAALVNGTLPTYRRGLRLRWAEYQGPGQKKRRSWDSGPGTSFSTPPTVPALSPNLPLYKQVSEPIQNQNVTHMRQGWRKHRRGPQMSLSVIVTCKSKRLCNRAKRSLSHMGPDTQAGAATGSGGLCGLWSHHLHCGPGQVQETSVLPLLV